MRFTRDVSQRRDSQSFVAQGRNNDSEITQAELQEYVKLTAVKKKHEALRLSLLARHERGEPVEPGALALRIDTGERNIPSVEKLTEALGKAGATQVLSMIEPTTVRYLIVAPTRRKPR